MIHEYNLSNTDPDWKLQSLFEWTGDHRKTAEENMNELYATILEGCNWKDNDFVEGFHTFMGSIIAAKSPLSLAALRVLHATAKVDVLDVLQPLGALLTGLS